MWPATSPPSPTGRPAMSTCGRATSHRLSRGRACSCHWRRHRVQAHCQGAAVGRLPDFPDTPPPCGLLHGQRLDFPDAAGERVEEGLGGLLLAEQLPAQRLDEAELGRAHLILAKRLPAVAAADDGTMVEIGVGDGMVVVDVNFQKNIRKVLRF